MMSHSYLLGHFAVQDVLYLENTFYPLTRGHQHLLYFLLLARIRPDLLGSCCRLGKSRLHQLSIQARTIHDSSTPEGWKDSTRQALARKNNQKTATVDDLVDTLTRGRNARVQSPPSISPSTSKWLLNHLGVVSSALEGLFSSLNL